MYLPLVLDLYIFTKALFSPPSLLYFSSYSNCASGFTEEGRKWSKHKLLHVLTSTATYCIHTQTLPLWSGGTLCSPGAYSLLLNLFLVSFLQLIPFIPSCRIIFISMKLFYNRSSGAIFSCCISPHLTAPSFVIKFTGDSNTATLYPNASWTTWTLLLYKRIL